MPDDLSLLESTPERWDSLETSSGEEYITGKKKKLLDAQLTVSHSVVNNVFLLFEPEELLGENTAH